MYMTSRLAKTFLALLVSAVFSLAGEARAQLRVEPVPNVASLPKNIPDGWVYAHDAAFYGLTVGKVLLIDPASDSRNVRGMIGAAQFAAFVQSSKSDEIYVAESFFSRGTRGAQTDVLSIYDTTTLQQLGEVVLPGQKRFQSVTHKSALQLTHDERFVLVFNFTPAQSVTIVDRKKREVVNEIPVPGCMLVYPQGRRGFASLCNDGSLLSVALSADGKATSATRSAPFNDIDNAALFMKPAWVGRTLYLTSFKGHIQKIDLKRDEPKIAEAWLIDGKHKDALPNARPSGWQIISADKRGRLYVLMRANAKDGEHKYGGQAVYVVDPKSKRVIDVIGMETDGFSIEVTRGRKPLLVVTNINMELDVYDLTSKKKRRTIGGWGPAMPLTLHGIQ